MKGERKGKRGMEKRENGEEKENTGNCERGGGKMEGERYVRRGLFFFFCLSLFETTEICLGCTKKKWEMGNFLTSPSFDCTPGYPPGPICQEGQSERTFPDFTFSFQFFLFFLDFSLFSNFWQIFAVGCSRN